jgi:hypothetical protein
LEGLLNTKINDYANWIKCAYADENVQMQQRFGENIELRVHLYPIQGYNHGWGTILGTMNKSGPCKEIKFLV